ncbi:MAG TPA: TlpA disulfide reductase family protein [Planctomycetota bacterium]|nr:TlpA disulfide reductase family protein [Planctomycetota bacterium]
MSSNRRTLLSLLFVLALGAAWFGVTSYIRAHVDDLIHASVGRHLPAFSLVDRTGRTWTDADVQGRRAVLHFFRSRCGACEAEAPAIRALEANLPGDVVLLHVMTDAVLEFEPELTAQTLAGKRFTRPVLMADAAFVNAFHKLAWSSVTPITYVVDAGGVVRFGLRGAQTEAAIEQALAAAR